MPVMYDAIYPDTIPATVAAPDYAAGYVDGAWPSHAAIAARFPKAVPVTITAIPGSPESATAQVCDVENGDYTAAQGGTWAKARFVAGFVPCLYTSESNWPALKSAVGQAGVDPDLVDWWIAGYPGSVGAGNLYPGSVAHQWIDRGSYDESVVVAGWVPGRPTRAPAPTPPAVSPEQEMLLMGTLPTNCSDQNAFNCQVRDWWNTYRTDQMTAADQNVLYYCFKLPATTKGSFGGNPDLVLAWIVDDARSKKALKTQFMPGAV